MRQAIEQKEQPMMLYGDYDVDGTSAVVILKRGIGLLGGKRVVSRSASAARWVRDAE